MCMLRKCMFIDFISNYCQYPHLIQSLLPYTEEQSWENLSFTQIISTEDKIGYILSRHPFPVFKKNYFCESYPVIVWPIAL